jgi:hypothetical protein
MFRMRQAEGSPTPDGLELLPLQPGGHFGFDISWRDAIDGDVSFASLARQRTRKPFKTRFGRSIDGQAVGTLSTR